MFQLTQAACFWFIAAYFLLARTAYALDAGSPGAGGGDCDTSPTGLVNPLKACGVSDFLFAVLDILLVFAVPIVVFFIIYAGFKFVTAQGDTGKIAEARSAFVWAVVGGVIVLGAKLLVDVIQGTVDAL